MNWDAIGAVGQMLGSLAVFITLGYLAVQVRHARGEMQRSVMQSRADGLFELAMNRANNQQVRSSFARAHAGLGGPMNPFVATMERSGLTVEEAYGLHWDQLAAWYLRVQAISYVDQMTAAARSDLDRTARRQYGSLPVSRLWYETNKNALSSDAVRYIDNLLTQPAERAA